MTERNPAKTKRAIATKPQGKPMAAGAEAVENARLKDELAAARARIIELEQRHADVINRIDWVIDSLQNLAN